VCFPAHSHPSAAAFALAQIAHGLKGLLMVRHLLSRFLYHEDGFILSSEALLMGTTVVVGLLVGLVDIRDNILEELEDFSEAVGFLNQSYSYTGVIGNGNDATTEGGLFQDTQEVGDFTDLEVGFLDGASEDD
jgi:hypothetical protein